MRIYHRYLGFFLAGIMAVYALSGIVLVYRDTDAFKKEIRVNEVLPEGTTAENLGSALRIKRFQIDKEENGVAYFKQGSFNIETREVNYTKKELPYLLDKMTHLHKATSSRSLSFLNVFFGVSLLFYVISSFLMFTPNSGIFKKGIYVAIAGIVFALVLIFV